jgi:DNA-binding Xre family transcriptional regulator
MVVIRLKELAQAKGLNKSQLQKRSGLDMGVIRRYWDDETESYNRHALDKLCDVLACTPGDLLVWLPTGGASRD